MSTFRSGGLTQPGKGLCRWCHKPVGKGRRTWCSQTCVEKGLIVVDPSYARRRVLERDRGICAQCGSDAELTRQVLRHLKGYDPDTNAAKTIVFKQWGQLRWSTHLWEMDHIKPVVEGGGECGLDNLRTLCIPCHRKDTAKLAARRARARREKGMPLLGGED